VGTAFSPLDEALGLLPGQWTPRLHEGLVLLSTWMPFAAAVNTLATLLGVRISQASAVRATEAAGAAYVELQSEEVARLERTAPPAPAGAERMVMSADGAMVPLLHGEWGEVRTLAIGSVVAPSATSSRRQTQALSYFSRLISAEAFTRQALVETHRRGVEHARHVAAVMDGADWLQGLTDHHCPRAVRILDFAHAAQRIAEIGQTLWGEKSGHATAWTTQWTHRLKHEGPQPLLTELRQLRTLYPDNEPLRINSAYLAKRQAQLHYPEFIQQGWPIGSGIVESANKSVVAARLKGAGMHWLRSHVDPMLALRNLVCNERWTQEWPRIHARLIAQAQIQRALPARQRLHAIRTQQHEAALAAQRTIYMPNPLDGGAQPHHPPPQKPKTNKPAHDHPWRRSSFGRATGNQYPKK
jgi:hypothetical protein